MKENEAINCLRCKHCQLLTHTDLSRALEPDAIIPIRCGKIGRNIPAKIHTPCDRANPDLPHGKKAMKRSDYRKSVNGNRVCLGDRLSALSEMEKQLLRVHYPTAPIEVLAQLMMRSYESVKRAAQVVKVHRNPQASGDDARRRRLALDGRAKSGLIFTEGQSQYVRERHARGDWPIAYGDPNPQGTWRQKQNAIKADILQEVAARGHTQTWKAILSHVCRHSPSAMREQERRKVALSSKSN